jgi:hypothetical protein
MGRSWGPARAPARVCAWRQRRGRRLPAPARGAPPAAPRRAPPSPLRSLTRPAPPCPAPPGRCYSNAQASVACSETSCTSGSTVDALDGACTSPLATGPDALWVYDPLPPYTCPTPGDKLTVKAQLKIRAPNGGTGFCTYAAHADLVGTGCSPGEYTKPGKGCVVCDRGYYCPDGNDRYECVDWETSKRGGKTEDDCYVASCDPCAGGDDNATTVYFTTATEIWRSNRFNESGAAERVCSFPPDADFSVADIAIDASGDALLIAQRNGKDGALIKVKTSLMKKTNPDRVCKWEEVMSGLQDPTTPGSWCGCGPVWTALGGSVKSNIFYAATQYNVFAVRAAPAPAPTPLVALSRRGCMALLAAAAAVAAASPAPRLTPPAPGAPPPPPSLT